jgi:hypothetical protein
MCAQQSDVTGHDARQSKSRADCRARCFLDPLRLLDRPVIANIAGVDRRTRLEEENVYLLVSHGPVLYAARNDKKLTWIKSDPLAAQVHLQGAFQHQEEFIL